MSVKAQYVDLGLIDYRDAWSIQSEHHRRLIEQKRGSKTNEPVLPTLFSCEHPPVFTMGRSGSQEHLKWDSEQRLERGVEYIEINRGGDVTHHGPGQLVVYPVFDLELFYRDVHRYVRELEEVVIRSVARFGIKGIRLDGYTGVWIEGELGYEKLCAIGVHLSRWVSLHGLALNICNDLSLFEGIVPCGISDKDKRVTSMTEVLSGNPGFDEVKVAVANSFKEVFNLEWKEI